MKGILIVLILVLSTYNTKGQDNSLKFEGTWIDVNSSANSRGMPRMVIKKVGQNFSVRAWNFSEATGEEFVGIYDPTRDYITAGVGGSIMYKPNTGTLLCWGIEFKRVGQVQMKANSTVDNFNTPVLKTSLFETSNTKLIQDLKSRFKSNNNYLLGNWYYKNEKILILADGFALELVYYKSGDSVRIIISNIDSILVNNFIILTYNEDEDCLDYNGRKFYRQDKAAIEPWKKDEITEFVGLCIYVNLPDNKNVEDKVEEACGCLQPKVEKKVGNFKNLKFEDYKSEVIKSMFKECLKAIL